MIRPTGCAGILALPAGRAFRILQLTDLHLSGSADDERTYGLIADLAARTQPDLLFFTGDQTMTPEAVAVYRIFAERVGALGRPWTYVFGNHDAENGVSRDALGRAAADAEGLLSARRDASGDSDFYLELRTGRGTLAWILFGIDTHVDAVYPLPEGPRWGYGAVSAAQTEWYEAVLRYAGDDSGETPPSLVFQHVPPRSVACHHEAGGCFEGVHHEGVSAPPVDFGQAQAMRKLGSTKGVFYGHDHVNDDAFREDGILFAYGRVSGHYDYVMPGFPKGARTIDLAADGSLTSAVVLHRPADTGPSPRGDEERKDFHE